MKNKFTILTLKIIANIIFSVIAFISLAYSIGHYGDGGCQGGVCGLGFIFHGIPLAFAWLFTVIALNALLMGSLSFFIFIGIGATINYLLLKELNRYTYSELHIPVQFLFLVQLILCIALVVWFVAYAIKNANSENTNPG